MKKSELKELIRHIVKEVRSIKETAGAHPGATHKWDAEKPHDTGGFSDASDDLLGLTVGDDLQGLDEVHGASTMKKSPDKKDNTQMGYEDKTITSTSSPKEKKEGKKLPVVQKKSNTETDHFVGKKDTATVPAGEKKEGKALPVGGHGAKGIKEDIMKMIRESLEEMARTAAVKGNDGVVRGGVSLNNRKKDPKSPTGWSMVGHKKFPDGTPVEAPKNTGANYVKKGENPNMGRPSQSSGDFVTTSSATKRTEAAVEEFLQYNPQATLEDVTDAITQSHTDETPLNLSPDAIQKAYDSVKGDSSEPDDVKGPSDKALKNINLDTLLDPEFGGDDDEF